MMLQEQLENKYSKYNLNSLVWADIEPLVAEVQDRGLELLEGLTNPSEVLKQIMIASTQWYQDMPLVSAGAMIAYLFENDYEERVKQIEMASRAIVLLGDLDLFDVYFNKGSYRVRTNIELEEETKDKLNTLMFLPPMVDKPLSLKGNTDSPFYTIHENLILGGKENFHNKSISLDVLNIQNKIKWELDEEFLSNNEEDVSNMEYPEIYLKQKQAAFSEVRKVDHFYITNSVDKRGRIYTNGYHINPQGTGYHKAMLNFADKELCR